MSSSSTFKISPVASKRIRIFPGSDGWPLSFRAAANPPRCINHTFSASNHCFSFSKCSSVFAWNKKVDGKNLQFYNMRKRHAHHALAAPTNFGSMHSTFW